MSDLTLAIIKDDIRSFTKLYFHCPDCYKENIKVKCRNNMKRFKGKCNCPICKLAKGKGCLCILEEKVEQEKKCKCKPKQRLETDDILEEIEFREEMYDDAFCLASHYGSLRIMKFLLSLKDIDIDLDLAFTAACDGTKEWLARYLLSIGAKVEPHGGTALYYAIHQDNISFARFLLENKANVTGNGDNDALGMAVAHNNIEAVELLIEYGADFTLFDNSVIKYYTTRSKVKMLNYLLSKGAEFDNFPKESKVKILQDKYYRKWRKIVLKNFIRKVVTPLYYSPGFLGGEKERENLEDKLIC